jgi:hypothetical protein
MHKPDDTNDHRPRSGLQNRMNDIQVDFLPSAPALTFRRTGLNSWEAPGTDFTLNYCQVNSWFVAYNAGRPLFTAKTLAEADQLLQGLLNQPEAP